MDRITFCVARDSQEALPGLQERPKRALDSQKCSKTHSIFNISGCGSYLAHGPQYRSRGQGQSGGVPAVCAKR